jgi:hypothetical protein
MTIKENVCVIGSGRSGSTVLFSLLDQIPNVFTTNPKEFVNIRGTVPSHFSKNRFLDLSNNPIIVGDGTIFTHLKLESDLPIVDNRPVDVSELFELCEMAGIDKFVHLRRQNSLRVWLSIVRGWLSESRVIFNRGHISEAKLRFKVYLEPMKCLEFICQLERSTELVMQELIKRKSIEIVYESHILGDPRIALTQLRKLVNLEIPENLVISYWRTNPQTVRESILNFDEIEEVLGVTGWAWMLEE